MNKDCFILTIDLEDWFHPLDHIPSNWQSYTRRIEFSTEIILDLLQEKKSTATFFVLGDVAVNHPGLIKKIHNSGHEIGSHSYYHKFIYKQSKDEFKNDLRKSINLLSDLTGSRISCFRAPYFSITKKSLWAFNILKEEGITIDSSIFPVLNHRYGIPGAPRLPYQLSNGIWEWPVTTYKTFLLNIPFSGGVYFRFLPVDIINHCTTSLLKKQEPVLLYFHPWEFDPGQPKLNNISSFLKFRHYYGLKSNLNKLRSVLNNNKTCSLSQGINYQKVK